jgi:hypothetical protein
MSARPALFALARRWSIKGELPYIRPLLEDKHELLRAASAASLSAVTLEAYVTVACALVVPVVSCSCVIYPCDASSCI